MDIAERVSAGTRAHARGLILAVLGGNAVGYSDRMLDGAEALGIDPLEYCIHRLKLDDEVVYERAARWAGFAFSDVIPRIAQGEPQIDRLDHLGEMRTFRTLVLGREVVFCAPNAEGLIRLAEARIANPGLSGRLCIVTPRRLRAARAVIGAEDLITEARQRLTRRWPFASADLDLTLPVRIAFVLLFAAAAAAVAVAPFMLGLVLLPLVAALMLVPAVLRFIAAVRRPTAAPKAPLLDDAAMPIYSVLIPLRDEAAMVPLLRRAMEAIDYPPEKLDIKFVVEERSPETIEAVTAILSDPRFELVVVPDAPPRTKPKALNFAMPLVRGAYVVVYDAEDIPDPGQLRLAASTFAGEPSLDCLQAELVVDNADENWLTALFAGEYAGQFGLMLPFLGAHRLPMPLGGTSNHFRTAALRELGHWDAFNVTEDADLGVRLSRLRYRTGVLASETSEEAPITLGAWMVQRTRWIKGWMQTFIVHNRNMLQFLTDIGLRNFLFFQIYVGGLILSSLLHTVFLLSFAVRAAFGAWPRLHDPVDLAYIAILVLGYGGTIVLVVAGLSRRRATRLLGPQALLPLYWILHSISALRAAWQLLVRPYFWGQTMHGRTRQDRRPPARP